MLSSKLGTNLACFCHSLQAVIWAQAVQEAKDGKVDKKDLQFVSNEIDGNCINEHVSMGNEQAQSRAMASQKNQMHSEAIGAQNGVFASDRRVQPRYQPGAKARYDKRERNREYEELANWAKSKNERYVPS